MVVVEGSAHGLDRDCLCSRSVEYKLTTAALVPLILDGPRIRLFEHGPSLLPDNIVDTSGNRIEDSSFGLSTRHGGHHMRSTTFPYQIFHVEIQ